MYVTNSSVDTAPTHLLIKAAKTDNPMVTHTPITACFTPSGITLDS